MNIIKYTIFDFFLYLIPGILTGSAIYFSISFEESYVFSIKEVQLYVNQYFSFKTGVLFIILSYILGHITLVLFKPIFILFSLIYFLFVKKRESELSLKKSEKYILTNQFTPRIYSTIEEYNKLYLFTQNIAFNLLLSSIILYVNFSSFSLIIVLIILLITIFLFYKSIEFKKWRNDLLDNSIELFDLYYKRATFFNNPKDDK